MRKNWPWTLKLRERPSKEVLRKSTKTGFIFIFAGEKQWFAILRYLIQEAPCELTAILFDGVDKLQHLLWRFIDPAYMPIHPSAWDQRIRDLCLAYFRQLDGLIAEIVAMAGPGRKTSIFLASDHGFGPSTEVFYINAWLHRKGYLTGPPTLQRYR